MNKLLKNLLTIHEKISEVDSFMNIKMNIESLKEDDNNYIELVKQTDLLINVLYAFSKELR